MEAIGVIGMIIAIVALIYLTFKGMNGFVASLAATVILIVTSGLPFWDTMVNTYAASMGKIFGSYLFMFCVASAYSELMKQSGAAESIANFFFSIFGVKASCAATVIISSYWRTAVSTHLSLFLQFTRLQYRCSAKQTFPRI